ncbi:MAG TPA: hypothetical protein VLV86_19530, partial [Vicinamibacterales bacterium]|nr:hypothetical protein [Vicinamibacterales bacterium]
SQLLPLCIGLSLRHRKPKLADRIERPLSRLSVALNLLLLGFVLAVQFRMLAKIRLTGYAGMLALVASSVIAGWVFGGRHADIRKSMVFATSVRNVGVSLVIASASFPDTPAVAAATAYAVFQTVVTAAVAAVWGTSTSSTNARSTKAA